MELSTEDDLQTAVRTGQIELVTSMLPTIDASIIKIPILHYSLHVKEIFDMLIEHPFDLNICDENGETVLHHALMINNSYYIQSIMTRYAFFHGFHMAYKKLKQCIKKYTPFEHVTSAAASFGLLDIIKWCHKHDKYFYISVMEYAVENGHLDIVKWFHKKRREKCWSSVMSCAARNGHLDIVKYFVKHMNSDKDKWDINNIISVAQPHVANYLREIYYSIETIEKEYFDDLSSVLYNNFIESNENNEKNHYQEIIKKVVDKNNVKILTQVMKLPRYDTIATDFIINYALSQKLYAFINEYCDENNCQNDLINILFSKLKN